MSSSSRSSLKGSVLLLAILFFAMGCRRSGSTGGTPTPAKTVTPAGAAAKPDATKKNDDGGHWTEEGEWVPDNKTIARTYAMPDMSAGLMYDLKRVRPNLAVELFDKRTCAMDIVGAEDFLGVGLSKRWTSIFEIKTGIGVGWDFERGWGKDEGEAGVNFFIHFLIIKF